MATNDREKSPLGSGDTAAPDICGQETGNSGGVGGPTAYFDFFGIETGYEGGKKLWVPWWRQ